MKNTGTLKVTTPSETTIEMRRTFDAPAQLVYDAFSKPELLTRWFGPRGHEMIECKVDLRVGGGFRFVIRSPDGRDVGMTGVYRELVPPTRSVHEESMDGFPGFIVVTTVFTERDGKTEMVVTLDCGSQMVRDIIVQTGMEHGAAESYDKLAELLA